ncbi:MAG: WD40 repeat domain-containing protein, partial [Anaerolineales bacterium]
DRSLYALPQGSGELYRWDPLSGSSELVVSGLPTTTGTLAVNAAGDRLAAGYCPQVSAEQLVSRCSVQLYDMASRVPLGEPISTTQSTLISLAFSPEGSTLASGDEQGTISLIDAITGQPGEIPLGGFNVGYHSLAFSPDGSTLAAGTDQGFIFLWDIQSGQVLGKPFQLGSQTLTGLAFAQDGRTLYAVSEEGQVSAWDVDFASWVQRACRLAGRSLTASEWRQFLGTVDINPACQETSQPTTTPTPGS